MSTTAPTFPITFILKDLTDAFYNGGQYSIGLRNLTPVEQFLFLRNIAARQEISGVTMKLGSASAFRDRVEFNSYERRGVNVASAKLEPRRGYMLVTFTFA